MAVLYDTAIYKLWFGVRPKCPVHSPASNLVRKPGSCPRSPFPRGAGARSLLSGPAGPLPALTGYSPSPPPRRLSPPGGCPHAAAAPAPPSWTPSPARSPLPRTPLPARRRLPQRSRLRPLLAAFRLLRAPRSAPPAPLDAPRPTHGGALSSYRGAAAERPRAQRLTPPHGSRAGPPAWPRPRRRGWGPAPGPASLPGLGPSVTGPASVSSARDPLAAHGTPLLPRLHDASEHNPKAPEAPPSLTPAPGTAAGLRPSPAPAGDPQRHLPSPHSAPARAHQATCAVPAWASARTTSGDTGEGERVLALESREGTRASRRVEEGLSRSLSGGGGKPSQGSKQPANHDPSPFP